jgi:cell division septation protein DedD
MNIHFGNQSQFELFPGTTGDPIENSAPRFIFSRIVLTFENVVVIFVFVIVGLIIAFSLGVERGRVKARLARPALIQQVTPVAIPSVMPNSQISVTPGTNYKNYNNEIVQNNLSGTAIASTIAPAPATIMPVSTIVKSNPASTRTAALAPVKPVAKAVVAKSVVNKPTTKAPPEKVVDKGYTVQVASYKSDSMAQKESADLKRKGLESFVITKGNYLIVCVGRFSGAQAQDEAKKMFNKLKKQYKDSIVRSF